MPATQGRKDRSTARPGSPQFRNVVELLEVLAGSCPTGYSPTRFERLERPKANKRKR